MYIKNNKLFIDSFGCDPATFGHFFHALSFESMFKLYDSPGIVRKQSGYVSRKVKLMDSPIFYSARKHMLYCLRPSPDSTRYCFRYYFARVTEIRIDGSFSFEVI